jgi:hypothetical protein
MSICESNPSSLTGGDRFHLLSFDSFASWGVPKAYNARGPVIEKIPRLGEWTTKTTLSRSTLYGRVVFPHS